MPALSEQASIHQPSNAAATSVVSEPPKVPDIATAHVDIVQEVVQVKPEEKEIAEPNTPPLDTAQPRFGLENIEPVIQESSHTLPDMSAFFSDLSEGPTAEQIRQEAAVQQAMSQVVEKPQQVDPDVDMLPTYNYEKIHFSETESEEDTKDIMSRRLGAAFAMVDHVDTHGKPDNPQDTLLQQEDTHIPFDTAMAVQESEGRSKIEGITLSEAAVNYASDQKIDNLVTEWKNEAGELDREKTARVLAAYGQEVLTAEEFTDIKQGVVNDLAQVDVASLNEAKVGIRNGEFVVLSDNGEVVTTLDKAKATVIVADATVVSRTADGELSVEDEQLVTLANKLRQTGFGLSHWEDKMVLDGQDISEGKFSKEVASTLPDGQQIITVEKGNKCTLVEESNKHILRTNFLPIEGQILAECPVEHETLPPGIESPHREAPMPAIPLVQNEKPPSVNLSAEQVSQQPVPPTETPLGQEGQVQVNQENATVVQMTRPSAIVIGDSLRAAFAGADQVGAFLYTLRQQPNVFQGVFPGVVPGRSFDFFTKGMSPFFANKNGNPFTINQQPMILGGATTEDRSQAHVFSMANSERAIQRSQAETATTHAEQREITHNTGSESQTISGKAQEVKATQRVTKSTVENTATASTITLRAEAVQAQPVSKKQEAHDARGNEVNVKNVREVAQQAVAAKSVESKAVESSFLRQTADVQNSVRHSVRQEIKIAPPPQKGEIAQKDKSASFSTASAGRMQKGESVIQQVDEHIAQESAVHEQSLAAQNEVVQYEILHMLTADVGTVIATGVPVLPEGERNKKGTQETIGEDEQVRSLGTNETNIRLDPAMLMSTITRQSFAQPSQPDPASAKNPQRIFQVPQLNATLSLARTFSANQNFPVADQHEAREFVSNVFAGM